MATHNINLSDTEEKCLAYASVSTFNWIDNAVRNRARIAKEEIIAKLVEHCNTNNIQLATGADAQVQQAYDLEVVKTAAQVKQEYEDSRP
tara:strand:- start:45 stop:314 length:270 start_codon:yes stop_codon:yes gene_type:complete